MIKMNFQKNIKIMFICQCRRISRYYIFLSSYASFISIIGFIIVIILFLSLLMLLLLLFLVVFTVVKHNTISYENTTSLRFGEPLTGSILDHFWSLWPSSWGSFGLLCPKRRSLQPTCSQPALNFSQLGPNIAPNLQPTWACVGSKLGQVDPRTNCRD